MESNTLSLSKALTTYLSSKRVKFTPDTLKELSKFVIWCGQDKNVDELKPHETAAYGDIISDSAGTQDTSERVQAIKDFLTFCYKNNITSTPLAKHLRVRKVNRISIAMEKLNNKIDMSEEGYQNMVNELGILRNQRVEIAKEISIAAADKDFRENAPLDAAREKQGFSEARIRELEDGLQRARLVSTKKNKTGSKLVDRIGLGSKITLIDKSNKEEFIYTIVNASEANPLDHKMSVQSPVGKAVVDRLAGESIEVDTPKGNMSYLIKTIS
jgi:transcription elongation factor GreA|tara:strand:- start:493 stop:1305 length:813 start_codon:yes stop_codon:yes gene_type:complete